MEQHLICLDLDGTLLNNNQQITPYTKEIIKKVQALGHHFMISTGRPYRASQTYYTELGLTTPIVNFNGAFVHHPTDMNFETFHQPLDFKVAREIFEKIPHLNIQNIVAEVKDHVYLHYHDAYLFEGFSMGNPLIQVGNLLDSIKEPPTSILIQAEEKEIPNIYKHLDDVYAEHLEHRRWGAPFPVIEIVKKGINKAVGVQIALDYLNIKRENTIAFGDEDNDHEMIQFVNTGVAMGNAINDLKEIADDITDSNNEDGIGKYLARYFNIE
ncbi:Cof-type HAD-IIB family hydrolase [Macrococcus epidermidis]|uniref:Cof-type HAD-IIB family hydrolase n=1 Tax=Macrococcus epidermidis TaxID=1902580 RepID=UPI001EF169DC|nr:Cof-type HAD-IIB family hydrolase [Macrococcus epidermidis]MCG7419342.1 Cof-type HAD-IIB family hydrolase [Macrococcus epidermidis]